jgi:hypothetical protein
MVSRGPRRRVAARLRTTESRSGYGELAWEQCFTVPRSQRVLRAREPSEDSLAKRFPEST